VKYPEDTKKSIMWQTSSRKGILGAISASKTNKYETYGIFFFGCETV
jgi:hypothetical protein